jgi:transketolase
MEMEALNIAQRNVRHHFCVKLSDNDTTTQGKLQQAFADDVMSRAQAICWHNIFL